MPNTKIVVLDDDPTGIQTVHDIDVLMKFDVDDFITMMNQPEELVYLSTNSRSFLPEETKAVHQKIVRNLCAASKETGRQFLVISRGDSTMRGHFPLESEVIKEELKNAGIQVKGEVLCPYLDGIRKTVKDVHYVLSDGMWIECADSEFAKDATFGYHHSDIKDYVQEKYGRKVECVSIGLDLLDGNHQKEILSLIDCEDAKIIVNATQMSHLEAFVEAIEPVKHLYQYRTAASFVKAFAKVTDQSYLKMSELCDDSSHGGLILAGSHVSKTTEQIQSLVDAKLAEVYVLKLDEAIEKQLNELAKQVDQKLLDGKNVLVMTSRKRIDFEGDAFDQLLQSRKISEKFVSLLPRLSVRPKFLISKGGITSFDVLNKGLHVASARVLGQVEKNIPVVQLREESLYPGMSVVIFPGNVGEKETLKSLVEKEK